MTRVYSKTGQELEELELNPEVFGVEVRKEHLHMAVIRQLANMRVGTASTKTRGEVSGGGKKPWKQKGTGRARCGSSRSPIWKGGGITFGPKPRDYSLDMPRKMRRLALKEALSSKNESETLKVVDSLSVEPEKGRMTKQFVEIMKNLELKGKTLFVLGAADDSVRLAGRNIEGVKIVRPEGVNVYDLLNCDTVVFDKEAVKSVEEVLA